jgi:3-hydroxybutyryl-CoA dehydrogenase
MVRTIGIVGAGTMGSGIAEVAAVAGFEVIMYDVSADALHNGMERIRADLKRNIEKQRMTDDDASAALARVHPRASLDDLAPSDFVIEAALEDIELKKAIFTHLSRITAPATILASNTSSLSITSLASFTTKPECVVGMHFFNPPPLMKLVEVVRGNRTSEETLAATSELARTLKKEPVVCKDTPGFIVNRVARPFYGEALRLLGEGVADVATIDRIVKASGGFKMGPFELMDLIGIDVNYAVTKSVYEQFFHEPRFRPHPIQRQMVEAGALGRKTKRGFYDYQS